MQFVPAIDPLQPPTETAWWLAFVDGKLLLPADEALPLGPLVPADFEPLASARHFLGRLDGLDCWVARLDAAPPGWREVPLRAAMMQFPAPLMGLAGRAAQVLEWDRTHRHCGVCGTLTLLQPGERARRISHDRP